MKTSGAFFPSHMRLFCVVFTLLFPRALVAQLSLGDLARDEAVSHFSLGNLAIQQSDNTAAAGHYRQAAAIFLDLGDYEQRGQVLMKLAPLVGPEEAVQRYREAAGAFRQAGNVMRAGLADAWRGWTLEVKLQRHQEATQVLEEIVETFRQWPPTPEQMQTMALAWRGLGLSAYEQERYETALGFFQEALPLDRQLGSQQQAGMDCQLIAESHLYLKRHTEAIPWFEKAFEAYRDVGGDSLPMAIAMLRYAGNTHLLATKKDLAAALAFYQQALHLADQHGIVVEQAHLNRDIGAAYLLHGDSTEAALLQSVEYLQAAIGFYQVLGDTTLEQTTERFLALARNKLGKALAQDGSGDGEALAAYRAALNTYQKEGDARKVAHMRNTLGVFHFRRGQWRQAAEQFEAYAAWLQSKQESGYIQTCHLLSMLYWNLGETDRALDATQRALVAADASGDALQAFQVRWSGTLYYFMADDLEGGRAELARLENQATTDDQRAMLINLQILSAVSSGQNLDGHLDKTSRWLRARLERISALPAADRAGFVGAWHALGGMLARTGRTREGLEALEVALALAESSFRPAILVETGQVYRSLGQLQAALDAYGAIGAHQQSLTPFLEPWERVFVLLNMLEIQQIVGDTEGMEGTLQAALALGDTLQMRPHLFSQEHKALGDLWGLLGQTAYLNGNAQAVSAFASAFEHYAHTGVDARVLKNRVLYILAREVQETHARQQEARMQELADTMAEAVEARAFEAVMLAAAADFSGKPLWQNLKLEKLEVLRIQAMQEGHLYVLPFAERELAGLYRQRGDLDRAETLYRSAVKSLDVLRSSILSDQHKIGFYTDNDEYVYADGIGLLLERGKVEDALELSERSRGRAFLDLLATADLKTVLRRDPTVAELDSLIERLQVLARQSEPLSLEGILPPTRVRLQNPQTRELQTLSLSLAPGKEIDHHKQALAAQLLETIESRRRALDQSGSELTSLVTAPVLTGETIRSMAARAHLTFVEYYLAPNEIAIFTVSPQGAIRCARVPVGRDSLEATIVAARRALGVEIGRGTKLVGRKSGPTGSADRHLAALYAMLIAPIAEVLPADERAMVCIVPHKTLFLVPFAALRDERGRYLAEKHTLTSAPAIGILQFTAKRQAEEQASPGLVVVGNPEMPSLPDVSLAALPGAEREAEIIAGIFGQGKVAKLIGPAANERAVTAVMKNASMIHLATHGVMRGDDAMQSFIALTPTDTHDGLLTVEEVFKLRLRADLVALSACQTGLGTISGDGVMGLGRAFLFAGAPSVLVSLWSVSDEATAFHMAAFYRHLVAGKSKAFALRQAQLETRAKYPRPEHWAAFALIGDGG